MDSKELRNSLDELISEIDLLDGNDPHREKLHGLVSDIEARLAESQLPQEAVALDEQVEEAISHFEVEHPTVAGILRRVMVTLSSMGV